LEAFKSRGGVRRTSKDLEDIVFVLDGHLGFEEELKVAPLEVREYLRKEFRALLKLREPLKPSPGI